MWTCCVVCRVRYERELLLVVLPLRITTMELFLRARAFFKHNAAELGGEVAKAHTLRLVDVVVATALVMVLTVRAHSARHLCLPGCVDIRRGRMKRLFWLQSDSSQLKEIKRSLKEFCCCQKAIE